jgi:hypothetical protein
MFFLTSKRRLDAADSMDRKPQLVALFAAECSFCWHCPGKLIENGTFVSAISFGLFMPTVAA